jgi:glycosyltransferase involved in cell wall biosynthesis
MRIFVVGPIYPFRGGIAHSNRILCEQLEKNHAVTAISFSRMYPKLLYPGKGQRERNADSNFEIQTEYRLDSLNPATWLGLAGRIREERPERVIFQWWHTFFMPMYWTIARWGRNGRTQFGVVCQNVLPHENGRIHERVSRIFFDSVDYCIALSSSDLRILQSLVPQKPARWITECTSESQFGKMPTKDAARRRLGLQGDALLFFGFVRPYKGLAFLLKAIPQIIKSRPGLTLMIVGEFWKDRQTYLDLIENLHIRSNVMIVDRYVGNDEVPLYFAAADAVVLPNVSSSESGIIQLAYGLNVPIITTAVGGNVDLVVHGKTGILCEPESPDELARAILDYYDGEREAHIKAGMRENAGLFQWTADKEKAVLNLGE